MSNKSFNIYLNKMDTKQLWQYYMALMTKWQSLSKKHPNRKNIKVFSDVVLDEYFNRIEKQIDVPEGI